MPKCPFWEANNSLQTNPGSRSALLYNARSDQTLSKYTVPLLSHLKIVAVVLSQSNVQVRKRKGDESEWSMSWYFDAAPPYSLKTHRHATQITHISQPSFSIFSVNPCESLYAEIRTGTQYTVCDWWQRQQSISCAALFSHCLQVFKPLPSARKKGNAAIRIQLLPLPGFSLLPVSVYDNAHYHMDTRFVCSPLLLLRKRGEFTSTKLFLGITHFRWHSPH